MEKLMQFIFRDFKKMLLAAIMINIIFIFICQPDLEKLFIYVGQSILLCIMFQFPILFAKFNNFIGTTHFFRKTFFMKYAYLIFMLFLVIPSFLCAYMAFVHKNIEGLLILCPMVCGLHSGARSVLIHQKEIDEPQYVGSKYEEEYTNKREGFANGFEKFIINKIYILLVIALFVILLCLLFCMPIKKFNPFIFLINYIFQIIPCILPLIFQKSQKIMGSDEMFFKFFPGEYVYYTIAVFVIFSALFNTTFGLFQKDFFPSTLLIPAVLSLYSAVQASILYRNRRVKAMKSDEGITNIK